MGVIQLPRALLCDDSITGGILIVSAIGSNQMPLSMMSRARGSTLSFSLVFVPCDPCAAVLFDC